MGQQSESSKPFGRDRRVIWRPVPASDTTELRDTGSISLVNCRLYLAAIADLLRHRRDCLLIEESDQLSEDDKIAPVIPIVGASEFIVV